MSSAVLSPHVQAVVHSGPLLTVIWWSYSPALRQCRPVQFLWLVKHLEWTSSRSKAPSKQCLFSIPPPSKDCSFPLGLGWERLWVGILKGRYINFDWLIDWYCVVSGVEIKCTWCYELTRNNDYVTIASHHYSALLLKKKSIKLIFPVPLMSWNFTGQTLPFTTCLHRICIESTRLTIGGGGPLDLLGFVGRMPLEHLPGSFMLYGLNWILIRKY